MCEQKGGRQYLRGGCAIRRTTRRCIGLDWIVLTHYVTLSQCSFQHESLGSIDMNCNREESVLY